MRRSSSLFLGSAVTTGVLFLVLAAAVARGWATDLDRAVAAWGDSDPAPVGVAVAATVLFVASVTPYVLVLGSAVALWRRRPVLARILLSNFAVSMVLTIVIKLATDRTRPAGGTAGLPAPTDEASFPSSSVVSCIAFWGLAGTLALIDKGTRGRTRALGVAACTLIVAVGPARLYVGGHWFTDIAGGYLLGAAMLFASTWLYLTKAPVDRDTAAASSTEGPGR